MRGLSSTLSQLMRQRQQWTDTMAGVGGATAGQPARSTVTALVQTRDFGHNPGRLEMFTYVPERLGPTPALVVVLHGCGQDAAGYNDGAGWSALADKLGFVVLLPQQTTSNNPKACFNWFLPDHIARGRGEARSIREMIARAVADHGVDPTRIFITGLSAGGAMAAVMLATYPEVFAGGAIMSGLPFGVASNVQSALDAMFKGQTRSAGDWGNLVRSASPHVGPWPKISIWYGEADHVVKPVNGLELVKQWSDVHGLLPEPDRTEWLGQARHEIWQDEAGRDVVEAVAVPGMGHGTAIYAGDGEMQGGRAGPFMLDVGISSTHHVARFWGLLEAMPVHRAKTGLALRDVARRDPRRARAASTAGAASQPPGAQPGDILGTIQNALKSAGLLR